MSQRGREVATAGLFAVIYFAAGQLSIAPRVGLPLSMTLWLPAGVGLAAFVLLGHQAWAPVILARAALAAQVSPALGFVSASVAADVTSAFAGAWLLRRAGFRPSLERLRDALLLIGLGVVTAPAFGASIGELGHGLFGIHAWARSPAEWAAWWRSDALGILIVAPILLTWCTPSRRYATWKRNEVLGLAALTAVTCFIIFLSAAPFPFRHPVAAVPVLFWAALGFGPRAASLATAAILASAVWGALHDVGAFFWKAPLEDRLRDLWFFMVAASGAGLTLAATLAEKTEVEEIRQRLATTLESTSDLVAICDLQSRAQYVNAAGRTLLGLGPTADISRLRIRDFHPPDTLARIENEGIPAALRHGLWSGETILLRRDGRRIPVSQVILAHKSPSGAVDFLSTIMRDISDRLRAEQALRKVSLAVSSGSGEACFQAIVRQLAESLGVAYALVGELDPAKPGMIRTLAFWSKGQPAANLEYHLEGSPCQGVVGRQSCVYLSGVQQAFPRDLGLVRLGVESYVGTPLFGSSGEALGLAAVMHTEPLADAALAQAMLEICSVRAANEIERLRVESALRASEAKYALAFRQSPDSVVIATLAEGRFVEANDSFLELYGASREEMEGKTVRDLRIWADERDRERLLADLRAGRKWDNVEVQLRRKSGELVIALLSSGVIHLGAVPCVLSTVRDITERKKAEQQLRSSEERYRDLFENANDIIVTVDPEGRFTAVNRKAEEASGYSRLELARMRFSDLVIPEQRAQAHQVFAQALSGERPAVFDDVVMLTKSGGRRHLELTGRAVFRDGRPVGVQAIARDVTDRLSLEAQFRQAQKMEAVGRLAAGVAHDFNNLLTVIQGYCDLQLPKQQPGSPVRSALESIRLAGKRAAGLTQQLLTFSRQQPIQPQILDLNAVLAESKKLLVRLIDAHVALEFIPAPALGRVRADAGLIGQIVMNLVVNARDAMPGGGRIIIETANVELDESYSRTHFQISPGRYVMLAVTDTGAGMDEATRAQIFEPFFTTKEAGKGTGLGLATVYGIVQQFKGHIWVYSEPGRGSTFKVYLPRVDAAAAELTPAHGIPVVAGGKETILLVEDEASIRALTREYLEMQGYTVKVAADPAEALRVSADIAEHIDLLLTDLVMPGMSGRELAESLTAHRPSLRVLYMSGYTGDAAFNKGEMTPGAAFLQKPFDLPSLGRKVRAVLGAP